MGLELAKEAYIRGADLTLVAANVSVEIPSLFDVIYVETSRQMHDAIVNIISDYDIFISAAAVSDFSFKMQSDKKIDSSNSISLNLEPTAKIIGQVKKINPNIFLVGFKAGFNISKEDIINRAKNQIKDSGTDLVVANDISNEDCHFGSDKNKVFIVCDEVITVPLSSKREVAKRIFDVITKKI